MIAVIDYGATNTRSIMRSLAGAILTSDPDVVAKASGVVLPGVGAFGPAMKSLRANDMTQAIAEVVASGRPFLGICLGMQLLFDRSTEMGDHRGLSLLAGNVRRLTEGTHIGWNQVGTYDSLLWRGIDDQAFFYFVHSYFVDPKEDVVIGRTEYGLPFACAVQKGNVFGVQFHPEKSQKNGERLLANFTALC